jgi:hypothetical protein
MSETSLIVPVPAAEPLVGVHRALLDPSAGTGVPAHITLLGPFVARDAIGAADLDELRQLFAATPTIAFSLDRVARFAHALYLEPAPAEPFAALTRAIWRRWPAHPPYGGEHREIVPHLTVAVGEGDFDDVRAALELRLPLAAVAGEAWLIAQSADGPWVVHRRFAFGPGPAAE